MARHRRHHHRRHYYARAALVQSVVQPPKSLLDMIKSSIPKLVIKSIVMTAVLFILTLPGIQFFSSVFGTGIKVAFSSLLFLASFVALFVLFSIYDLVASHKVWPLENLLSILFVLILLASTAFTYISLVLAFMLIFVSSLIGMSVRQVSLKQRGLYKAVGGSIAFLFVIWAIYVVLVNTNYYAPLTANSINLNKPYLTQQQLQGIYGKGTYSESALNAAELPIGELDLLFPTPIQTLLFNFTFQNTNSGASYYITYYNRTYSSNFTELVVETPQASIILATQAPHAINSGSSGNLQYIQDVTVNPNSYTALVQQSNFLAILSCSGVLCTQQNFNKTLQKISIGIS